MLCTRLTTTTLHSQRWEPSPLWFGIFPKRRIRRETTSIFRVQCEKAMRGCASRAPPSPGAPARRTRGGLVEGATLLFGPLVRHERGVRWTCLWPPFPPSVGVAPSTVIPAGRPSSRLRSRQRKSSRPQMAHRPREASLEDAHTPIFPIRSTCSLPLHLTAADSGLILG